MGFITAIQSRKAAKRAKEHGLKYEHGKLTDIDFGIICQQVNCKDRYNTKVGEELAEKWPAIEEEYHKSFESMTGRQLLGSCIVIELSSDLLCANIYAQYYIGGRSRKNYTDEDLLIEGIKMMVQYGRADKLPVYIPKYIGCGMDKSYWPEIECRLEDLDITVVDDDQLTTG